MDCIQAAAARIDPELAQQAATLAAAFQAVPLQDLLVDYTRLFLGAPQALAKPYASVWLNQESQPAQDSVLDLLKLYEQGGFEVDPDFTDLPDHAAVELEFPARVPGLHRAVGLAVARWRRRRRSGPAAGRPPGPGRPSVGARAGGRPWCPAATAAAPAAAPARAPGAPGRAGVAMSAWRCARA